MHFLALYRPLSRLGRPGLFAAVIVHNLEAADRPLWSRLALLTEAALLRPSSLMRLWRFLLLILDFEHTESIHQCIDAGSRLDR